MSADNVTPIGPRRPQSPPTPPEELLNVSDCVSRLDSALAVQQLVIDKLWDLLSEEGLDQVSDLHFAMECAKTICQQATNELREYPRGFIKEVKS